MKYHERAAAVSQMPANGSSSLGPISAGMTIPLYISSVPPALLTEPQSAFIMSSTLLLASSVENDNKLSGCPLLAVRPDASLVLVWVWQRAHRSLSQSLAVAIAVIEWLGWTPIAGESSRESIAGPP